jgi:uncharacterized membrane protein SpoIIM required for sporulation
MNLGTFVRKNRPHWQRLEEMLGEIERLGPRQAGQPFLHELLLLYRATTGDLAWAQTRYRGTTVLLFLHQLVARAHHQIYRPHRVSVRAAVRFFRHQIPETVRAHLPAVLWSTIVFLVGVAFGLAAVQFDPRAASVILPTRVLDAIYSGHMWTGGLFSVVPAPVASTLLFTNNISVALLAFAGGLSCGVVTFLILFQNGFMLGVVFALCSSYGLRGALLAFIASHGLLEISAILVSGAAGFVVANALLNPGRYSRADALAVQGRSAVRMAIACVPALVAAGCIEGFISPSGLALGFKLALGLGLGALFWIYLLLTGGKAAVTAAPIP